MLMRNDIRKSRTSRALGLAIVALYAVAVGHQAIVIWSGVDPDHDHGTCPLQGLLFCVTVAVLMVSVAVFSAVTVRAVPMTPRYACRGPQWFKPRRRAPPHPACI
jgi:hypothetical protein